MLWKMTGYSQPSPIEQILQKDNFTLEELLEEEDLVQECKALNGRLIEFLKEPDTVSQLVGCISEPPPPGAPTRDTSNNTNEASCSHACPCCELTWYINVISDSLPCSESLTSLLKRVKASSSMPISLLACAVQVPHQKQVHQRRPSRSALSSTLLSPARCFAARWKPSSRCCWRARPSCASCSPSLTCRGHSIACSQVGRASNSSLSCKSETYFGP